MRVLIEVLAEIEDPTAAITLAREEHERCTSSVDVDGMTEEEALAVADLTTKELRAHPRRITPERAIPDGAAALLWLAEAALAKVGAMPESSSTRILGNRPALPRERGTRGRERHPARSPQPRRVPRPRRGRGAP